jgi:hypothetical protein
LVYFVSLMIGIGCSEKEYAVPPDPNELLRIVADRNAKCSGVVKAAQRLGPVTEPPDFWTRIANSAEYTKRHRRVAVIELFRRHVKPGMTVGELGTMLEGAAWLSECGVSTLAGKIIAAAFPLVTVSPATIEIVVFRELPGARWRIYLRLSGEVEVHSFTGALAGEDVDESVKNTIILEIGIAAMQYGDGVWESSADGGPDV